MSRRTFIYDHDLDAMVDITRTNREPPSRPTRGIIRDIEPYRAVGSDIATQNKRPVIGGRRQHREFLRRNGYIEVGTERPHAPISEQLTQRDRIMDIKRMLGE